MQICSCSFTAFAEVNVSPFLSLSISLLWRHCSSRFLSSRRCLYLVLVDALTAHGSASESVAGRSLKAIALLTATNNENARMLAEAGVGGGKCDKLDQSKKYLNGCVSSQRMILT